MRLRLVKIAQFSAFRLLLVTSLALASVLWNSFCPPDVANIIATQSLSHFRDRSSAQADVTNPYAQPHETSDSHHRNKSHGSTSHEVPSSQDSDGCCRYKPDATHAVLQGASVTSPRLIHDVLFLIAVVPISLTTSKLSPLNNYLHYGGRLASSLASTPIYQSLSHYLI